MTQVVRISGEGGRSISFADCVDEGDGDWRYSVTLEFETGRVRVGVSDYGEPRLPQLFSTAAAQWRGFDDRLEFASIEGHLKLVLTHDGKGTIECLASVGQPWPPEWSTTMTLAFGAGTYAQRIAEEMAAFFDLATPGPRHRGDRGTR